MPKRINPFVQYLIYLAGTLAAYGIYAAAVVPKIESNASVAEKKMEPRTGSGRTNRKQKFAHLFPVDAWEMQACKILETSQGTVLFKDYQPFDDGRVEVFPFTMIIRSDSIDDGKEAVPIVLRSSQKAILQFERAFQLNGGDAGKIQNGQLTGQVSIYRPPSEEGKDDYLKVLTSNVQLEKHKIFTVDDVEFEFGGNHGRGRNLNIELSHNAPLDAINTDFSKIDGVKSLKLGFLQRMRIHPTSKKKLANRLLAGQRAPIEIRCQGAFGFDFEKQEASFLDQVTVQQLDGSGQSLSCEQLKLIFDSVAQNDSQPLVLQQGKSSLVDRELHLRKIVAMGSPVHLTDPSKNAVIRAEYLDYDLDLNTVIARSKTGALFQMENQQFISTDIQYRIRDDGAIGPLIAEGQGSMRHDDGKNQFEAKWSKSLTIEPDTHQRKLVTLEGETEITLDGETTMGGNGLKIWLWEIPQVNQPTDQDDDDTQDKSSWQYLPHELRSDSNVYILSPKMAGNMKTLIARWPAPNPLSMNRNSIRLTKITQASYFVQDGTPNDWQPQTNLAPVTRIRSALPLSGEAESIRRDANVKLANFVNSNPDQANSPAKLNFTGDHVEVDFDSHERDANISQLVIEGDVRVLETSPSDPDAKPFEIVGQQLLLIPQGKDIYRFNVSGNAKVEGKGLTLSGSDIHLDQQANRLWVDGQGTMNIEQSPPKTTAMPNAAVLPGDVTISWRGGMIFDGQKMYFEEEVAASGIQHDEKVTSQVRSLSAGLSVMLKRSIDFKQLKANSKSDLGKIEIQEMILVNQISEKKRVFAKPTFEGMELLQSPVVFEKIDIGPGNQLIGKQKMIVPHASIDLLTGNIRASGPGTIMTWQLGKEKSSGEIFQQASLTRTGRSFLRINFDEMLIADGHRNHARITGKVRTLFAPVDNFEQQFNPDNPTRPAGAIKLVCDEMEMAQWQQRGSQTKTDEITALGNSRIVGDQFEATANQLNYSEIKDLITLEGSTRDAAKLFYVEPNSRNRRNLEAGKILYRPSDGWAEIQKTQEASMSQSGSLFQNN